MADLEALEKIAERLEPFAKRADELNDRRMGAYGDEVGLWAGHFWWLTNISAGDVRGAKEALCELRAFIAQERAKQEGGKDA